MCELGTRLREAREAQGKDIAELARQLMVRRAFLEALEECRFSELPESVLARGYLRRYALKLGLDPEPLLALYPRTTTQVPFTPLADGKKQSFPRRLAIDPSVWLWLAATLILVSGLAALLLTRPPSTPAFGNPGSKAVVNNPARVRLSVAVEPAGASVYLDGFLLGPAPAAADVEVGSRTLRVEMPGYQPYQAQVDISSSKLVSVKLEPEPKPDVLPPQTSSTNEAAGQTRAPDAPQTSLASPASTAGSLVLRFEGKSWVRITNPAGQRLYEGIPATGTTLTFDVPVVVRAGNAGVVRVNLNGKDLGLMGNKDEVAQAAYP